MWNAIAYVSSGVTVVAFVVAVSAWVFRASLVQRERLIKAAPEVDRGALVETALEVFRVDTSGLTRDQKYRLAMEQIAARERRFKTVAGVVSLVAVLLAVVSAYAIAQTSPMSPAQPPGSLAPPAPTSKRTVAIEPLVLKAPIAKTPTRLHIKIGSMLSDRFDFTIGSTGREPFVMKSLFMRLRGYADCPLRNERSVLGAATISTAYSVELSKDYARYDLPSLASAGDRGVWTYPGSPDYFSVELLYPAYVLFVLTLEAEGDFLAGESFHVSSEEIHVIDVAHGNFGECLDLSSWYRPELLRVPPERAYLDNGSVLARQLLTVDLSARSSFVFRIPKAQLARVLPELEALTGSRRVNEVFARNLQEVRAVLSGRSRPQ